MTYACEDCGFLFRRTGEATQCPSCEKHRIRPASQAEEEQLKQLLNAKKNNIITEERSI